MRAGHLAPTVERGPEAGTMRARTSPRLVRETRLRGRPRRCARRDRRIEMPRYVVERTFPEAWRLPVGTEGAALCLALVEQNANEGVTWLHSYVRDDKRKTFCVYDAPNPEGIRKTAARNDLPVDRITQVSVLAPYSYV